MPTPTPSSRRRPSLRVLAGLAAALLATCLTPALASATVVPVTASFASGDFSSFSQTNALQGSLGVVPGGYGSGHSASATYSGGGQNGFSRAIYNVDWQQGDDVWYGAAYYLPTGFHAAMQGQVAVLRWDNYPLDPSASDQGGVVINGGDKRSYLERDHQNPDGSWSQSDLVGPFDLPEGRWFWLEVHQHLGSAGGAYSEVFVDSTSVGASSNPNMFGRNIERIRYGLVAIAETAQLKPLSLQFDRAAVSTSQVGPLPGLSGPPAPTPAPPAPTSAPPASSGSAGASSQGSGATGSAPGSTSGSHHHPVRRPRARAATARAIGLCVIRAKSSARKAHRSAARGLRRCSAMAAHRSRAASAGSHRRLVPTPAGRPRRS